MSVVARAHLCVVLCVALSGVAHAERRDIPKESMDAAKSMADTVNSKMGTAEGIQNNAISPLSSDQAMTTMDGSKTFDAQLLCQGANTFADLMVTPLSNGNVTIRTIRQDTNMDGTIDSYQNVNWQASAICANGYMYCSNPNKATSCRSYQWKARSSDYLVGRAETAMTKMGGCYSINNASGSNLAMNNIETVLGDLASGISAALAEKHSFFTLTNIKIDGTYAELQGSDGADCNPSSADSVLGTEEVDKIESAGYASNPSGLKSDGFAAQNESDLYGQLSNNASDEGFQTRSCSVQRVLREDRVTAGDIVSFDSGTGGLYEIDSDTLRIILGEVGDNYWTGQCSYKSLQTRFFVHRPDRIRSARLKRAKFDDWMQVHVVQGGQYQHVWNGPYGTWKSASGNVPGDCELETNWDQNLNVDFENTLAEEGPVVFKVRVQVSGDGEGYVLGDIDLDTSCTIKPDTFADTCSAYQSNDKCSLVEETVDGVTTFRNGYATGLVPLPINAGTYCGSSQTRDWMKKERVYRCESNYEYDFEAGFDRMEYVKSNSTVDQWKDRATNYDSGRVTYNSGSFTQFNGLDAQACTMTCKTRKERPMNDMTLSGTTGSEHNTPVTYDFFYHQCTGASFNTCPSGPGEEVVKDCQCLNEFSESTAIMQSLRLAGQDMICTSGEPAMPDEGE